MGEHPRSLPTERLLLWGPVLTGQETRRTGVCAAVLALGWSADLASAYSGVHCQERCLFVILYLSSYNRKIRAFAEGQ